MFYNIHTHKSSEQKEVLDIINQYPHSFNTSLIRYSIGIHPWYIIPERIEQDLTVIDEKLSDPLCFALGESGLDKAIEIPLELQTEVFQKQLLLAEKHQKPVIIHCVKAFQEVIAVKKSRLTSVPLIIHGFSKNSNIAKQMIDNGFYLSFGKYLLQNPELGKVLQTIPEDRILFETDTIEESIQEVYTVAAKYLNTDLITLKKTIANNFKTIFKNGRVD